MCRRQVAQTVSHVMRYHMSSSGVMHGDGRQCGEEMVKHEVKKKNIAAVQVRYRNTIPPLRRTVLGLISPWSGPPRRTGHRPCCDRGVNSCPMNTSNEALRLLYPFPPLLMSSQPFLLAHPRLPLRYQKGILSCEGAIRGDEEHHLHQRRRLVLRCVGERLADAPASCLRHNRWEIVTTFPPFAILYAYLRTVFSAPRLHSHSISYVTFPFHCHTSLHYHLPT